MVRKSKNSYLILFLIVVGSFFILAGSVSAWDFYGYTYDVNGNVLYNTSINITIWSMAGGPPEFVGYNSTYSNETGWFNLTITENSSWVYKPIIRHFAENKTDGSTHIDFQLKKNLRILLQKRLFMFQKRGIIQL